MSRRLLPWILVALVTGLDPAADASAAPPQPALAVTVDHFQARTFDDGAGHTLPYRIYLPALPAGGDPARKIPLVLFLHGAGGRGTDNRHQITDQQAPLVFVQPETQARWPLVMVAPQCPPGEQWVAMPWGAPTGKGKRPAGPSWPLAAAVALVDKLAAELPNVDRSQLYVTGISMGGYGTFDAAVRYPGKWRAAVPICGGYDETQIAPIVRLPLWAFHAEDDRAVPVARSREVIAAMRAAGGNPRYTEYPASARHGHFSWIPAYADPELLPWMFGPHTEAAAPATPPASAEPARPPTAPVPPATPPPGHRRGGCGCDITTTAGSAPGSTLPPSAVAHALLAVAALLGVRRLRPRRGGRVDHDRYCSSR
jgi:predicted peptidase